MPFPARACLFSLLFGVAGADVARANGIDLQCVPYARVVSGVMLRGDAHEWWKKAAGVYDRGHRPRVGAVMAFRAHGPMELGHVAVVSRIISDTQVLVRHANWSRDGAIEEDVPVHDISAKGDWSMVRVWYSPDGKMGSRANPLYGFIYSPRSKPARFRPERDAPDRRYVRLDTYRVAVAEKSSASPRTSPDAKGPPVKLASATVRQTEKRERTLADIIADVKRQAKIG